MSFFDNEEYSIDMTFFPMFLTISLLMMFQARFAVTKFTYHKNGGKIPVTEGKTVITVYQLGFLAVKVNLKR